MPKPSIEQMREELKKEKAVAKPKASKTPSLEKMRADLKKAPPSDFTQYALKASEFLPAAGGAIGGILGAPAGPITAVGGATLGAAGGEAFRQLAQRALAPEEAPASSTEALEQIGGEALLSGATEYGFGKAAKGLKALSQTAPVAKMIAAGKKAGTEVASVIGNTLTGVPKKNIETLIKQGDEVASTIKKYKGDISEAANEVRSNIMDGIQSLRRDLNSQISKALSSVEADVMIDPKPIYEALESAKNKIDPNLYPEQLGAIDDMIGRIRKIATRNGLVTEGEGGLFLHELNSVKGFLQERAAPSYLKDGQIFIPGKESQKAAKSGAAIARKTLNSASPEIAKANNKLFLLHDIENKINKNLIKPESPDAAIFGVGAGTQGRNKKMLERLGGLLDKDLIGEAEKISAAKEFSQAELLPRDVTGKSLTRMLGGTAVGGSVGGPMGAVVGGALTSPLALKTGIRGAQMLEKATPSILRGAAQFERERIIEGFKESQLNPVTAAEAPTFVENIKKSQVSPVQRAKQLNLLNKHGMIVIEPEEEMQAPHPKNVSKKLGY